MKNLSNQPCLIARSLALVGDAWSMLILRDAHAGLTRFFDAETGTEIDPVTIDRETGAPVGTRPIRIAVPE